MDRPQVDRNGIFSASDFAAKTLKSAAQHSRHLSRKLHIEAQLANAPCNEMAGFSNLQSKKAVDRQTSGFGAYQARGTAVCEEQERENLFQIIRLLHVQRAELQIQDQDLRVRFRSYDVMRRFQCIDGCIASHKADHGAFN